MNFFKFESFKSEAVFVFKETTDVLRQIVQSLTYFLDDRMTNNTVYVCADSSDSSCQECGRVTGLIPKGGWAEISCSLRGTVVSQLVCLNELYKK